MKVFKFLSMVAVTFCAVNSSNATTVYGSGGIVETAGKKVTCPNVARSVCATYIVISGPNPVDVGSVLEVTTPAGTTFEGTLIEVGDPDANGDFQGQDLVFIAD